MAIREVRVNFVLNDKKIERAISRDLWMPFSFSCDAIMRGGFKRYSGHDVNGVNIVNINLYEDGLLNLYSQPQWKNQWVKLLNSIQYDTTYEYGALLGDTAERIQILMGYAARLLEKSTFPTVSILGQDLQIGRHNIDYQKVIAQSRKYENTIKARI